MTGVSGYQKRKQKWETTEWHKTENGARKASFILTVANTLGLLDGVKEGRLLDIGCGFGEIDIVMARQTNFLITGCDISDKAIKESRERIIKEGLEKRITVGPADVYNLKYQNNSFDVITSFGYVSAATYKGVQKEAARVLRPGGILICDFINSWSLYKAPISLVSLMKGNGLPYFASLSGIKNVFEQANLIFEKQTLFNTYPPLPFLQSTAPFILFEKTLGRVASSFLGRVRLVKFRKK